MEAFAYVFRIEFHTVKVVLDYIGPKIRHHSSRRMKTCYVLRMRNRDFLTSIPHVGLKICCHL